MNGRSYQRSWRKGFFACIVLALSLSSQFSPRAIRAFSPHRNLRIAMHGGIAKRPARFNILLDPPYVWIIAARRRGDIDLCVG